MNASHALRVLSLLMALCVAHCQWANSIGWGGAGAGKRSPGSGLLGQVLRRQGYPTGQGKSGLSSTQSGQASLSSNDCQPDPDAIKLVSSIIREQEVRVQQCLSLPYR